MIRETRLIQSTRVAELKKVLIGDEFDSIERYGKYLLIKLAGGGWLVMHFGMTGDLAYFKASEKEPKYTQVLFVFTNGYHLAYQSPRKLGAIQFLDSKENWIKTKGLGLDVMGDDFNFKTFQQALAGRRGMLKTTLMNQSILAGIGNVYSDEILFQAGFHPRTRIDQLDKSELSRLYKTIVEVLKTITDSLIHHQSLPATYLVHHRNPSEACPCCEGKVRRINIGGRHGYYYPCRQGGQPQNSSEG